MNLRSIDMNLLVVLDALLDEAHVSRAAQRLHLSQPAVSSALQRCRHLFGDELLERGRGMMRRTPRAEALRAPLKTLLADAHNLVDPPEVPLSEISQTVRVRAADHPVTMLVQPLLARLRRSAPGIDLVFQPWQGTNASCEALIEGDSDLAVAVIDREVEGIERRQVLFEDYVVVMRREHPAAASFGLDSWLQWPHVVVSGRGDRRTALDAALAAEGRKRCVGLVVPFFHMVPELLCETDFIAMLPRHSVPSAAREALAVFDPPHAIDGFPLHLAWHHRQATDAAIQHVADTVTQLFAEEFL